ncbi:MAG: hypothetical protein IKZ36_02160 [Kiritimatiellae bacterium]|nr:hypothetical protein [Kiritimatiellia bacterium]
MKTLLRISVCAGAVLGCMTGCNTPQIVNKIEQVEKIERVEKIDPTKKLVLEETRKINAEVDKFLKSNDCTSARKYLLDQKLMGDSGADCELGRVRLQLLVEKVLNKEWTCLKASLEQKYNSFKNLDSADKLNEGVAYFTKLNGSPIQSVALPHWMALAAKELPQFDYEAKRKRLNNSFAWLRDKYKAGLERLYSELIARQFTAACDKLLEQVRVELLKHNFTAARRLLGKTDNSIPSKQRPAMLAFRIGVLNTIVNPLQYEFVKNEISEKIKEFCDAEKFSEAIDYLKNYKIEGTDNEVLTSCLRAVQKEAGQTLCLGDKELEKFYAAYSKELQKLLDDRKGQWRPPADGAFAKSIVALESAMKEEIPDAKAVGDFIRKLREFIGKRNLTTGEMKSLIAWSKFGGVMSTAEVESSIKAYQEHLKTEMGHRLFMSVLQRLCTKAVATSADGVDFFDEIKKAEFYAQLKNQNADSLIRDYFNDNCGLICADYARNMRMLASGTNNLAKVDLQVLLGGAVVMGHMNVAKWAAKAGADLTALVPNLGVSPIVLAAETENRKMLAWLIENKAASKLDRDGLPAFLAAVKRNRCDMMNMIMEAGFCPTKEQNRQAVTVACEHGSGDVFMKYVESGMNPTSDDFVLAAKSGDLSIVRWFVEKGFFSVNEKNLVEAVRKCCPQEKDTKKCPHQKVREYLIKRGMQM